MVHITSQTGYHSFPQKPSNCQLHSPSPVGAADPCGPLVWGSGMFRFVVPRGRLWAAEVCGPYEKIRMKFIQIP